MVGLYLDFLASSLGGDFLGLRVLEEEVIALIAKSSILNILLVIGTL